MDLKVGERVGLVYEKRDMKVTTEVVVRRVKSDRVAVSYGPDSEVSWFRLPEGQLIRSHDFPSGWRLLVPFSGAHNKAEA